jgi:hypothetical protein
MLCLRNRAFRRSQYQAPYRGSPKPPLEVVVLTFPAQILQKLSENCPSEESQGAWEECFSAMKKVMAVVLAFEM